MQQPDLVAAALGARFLDSVGVTLQAQGFDCGPAVLHMLLVAHGRNIPYDSVLGRKSDPGAYWSFADIQIHAAALDLDLVGYRANSSALQELPVPFIAHGFAHFVVVDTVSPTRVVVRDPWVGRLQFSPAAFDDWWSEAVLVVRRIDADGGRTRRTQ
jgi:ABC-type bacteriocin/lantibiotic exporter with double-glycine peptidase domain